jgi:hypothetical protein
MNDYGSYNFAYNNIIIQSNLIINSNLTTLAKQLCITLDVYNSSTFYANSTIQTLAQVFINKSMIVMHLYQVLHGWVLCFLLSNV